MKHFMAYGWVDINAAEAVVHVSITGPYMWRIMTLPLVNCILSDVVSVMPNTQQSLLLLVNVVYLWLINSFLDDTPLLVVD